MANGDAAFAASTAQLTFQSFLEKMRHPSASELVKSIKVRAVPISLSRASGRFPRALASHPDRHSLLPPPSGALLLSCSEVPQLVGID